MRLGLRGSRRNSGPGPWPWPAWPRVLIEHPDEVAGLRAASALRLAGYAVAVCPGPGRAGRCPLTGPDGCAIADGADVVVSCLGLERPEAREVPGALREHCPGTALVVEAAPGQEAEWRDLVGECELLVAPVGPERLVASVGAAVARRQEL